MKKQEKEELISTLTDKFTSGEITAEFFKAAMIKLQKPRTEVLIKIGKKGLSVHLPSQTTRPTTLEPVQWTELLAATPQILEFLYEQKEVELPDREKFTDTLIAGLQAQRTKKKAA